MREAMNSMSPWSLSAEIDAGYSPTPMLLAGVYATISAVPPAPSIGRAMGSWYSSRSIGRPTVS
jgi:hypothetical protein